MIPYILTEESLTVVIDGKAETMSSDHPAWEQAKEALAAEEFDRLKNLFDVESAVQDYLDAESEIEVKDGAVYHQGEAVHNLVVDKILDFMRSKMPYQPLVKFLGKLMDNPSHRATDELYAFLEHKNMPITPEGNFLAYKGVNQDFTDFYSGKFDNSVGQTLEMRRNGVCDDLNKGCSAGFHAGSHEYAKGYASGGGHLLIVEINPADVVSVPLCSDCQKLRTAKYKVVGVMESIEAPPLDDGLNVEYSEGWYSNDENEAWAAGYEAARQEIREKLDGDE